MGRSGWWAAAAVLVLAWPARAQVLEGAVRKGACRVAGTLAGGLAVEVAVESHPARPLTPEESQAAKDAGLRMPPPAGSEARRLKSFTLRIGGREVPVPAGESAGLVDLTGVRVWRQEAGVYCRLLGRSGTLGYAVTFAFVEVRNSWVQANRTIQTGGVAQQETRERSDTVDSQ